MKNHMNNGFIQKKKIIKILTKHGLDLGIGGKSLKINIKSYYCKIRIIVYFLQVLVDVNLNFSDKYNKHINRRFP